jgi:hypothetical protein
MKRGEIIKKAKDKRIILKISNRNKKTENINKN